MHRGVLGGVHLWGKGWCLYGQEVRSTEPAHGPPPGTVGQAQCDIMSRRVTLSPDRMSQWPPQQAARAAIAATRPLVPLGPR